MKQNPQNNFSMPLMIILEYLIICFYIIDVDFGFMVLVIPKFTIATDLNKPTHSMYSHVRDGAVSAEVREGRASQFILWT